MANIQQESPPPKKNTNKVSNIRAANAKSAKTVSLDTLGYLRKKNETYSQKIEQKQFIQDNPHEQLTPLAKRARSKFYTTNIIGPMVYLDSPMQPYYQRAYNCCERLTQHENRVKAKYCDTRICHVCNRIRTGKLMNGYIMQMGDMEQINFVTLTMPTVLQSHLRSSCEHMNKQWRKITDVFRKCHVRMNGIRKLEITYNTFEDWYHPHFHVLTDSNGDDLVSEWLRLYPTADQAAQKNIPNCDQGALNEIFKYTTKMITRNKDKMEINIHALDVICTALKNKRTFQPFGNIKKVSEKVQDELKGQEYEGIAMHHYREWEWNTRSDWQHGDDLLTGYLNPIITFEYVE